METDDLLAYNCSISQVRVRCQEARGQGSGKRCPISRNFGAWKQTGSCFKTWKAPRGRPSKGRGSAREPGLALLGYALTPFRGWRRTPANFRLRAAARSVA